MSGNLIELKTAAIADDLRYRLRVSSSQIHAVVRLLTQLEKQMNQIIMVGHQSSPQEINLGLILSKANAEDGILQLQEISKTLDFIIQSLK